MKFCSTSNKPKTCRKGYRHRKHYKTYNLSCLEQLFKIDFSREQQRTKSLCIWNLAYATGTDDEGCSENFLKTRISLWPTLHHLCYASNKPKTRRICYWHHKYYSLRFLEPTVLLRFIYGLPCLEKLFKMAFHWDSQRARSECIVHTSN